MPNTYLRYVMVPVLIGIMFLIIGGSTTCFAENSPTDSIIDFSKGPQGFTLDDHWGIEGAELRFTPIGNTQSLIYYNILPITFPAKMTISVEARWGGGSDAGYYGLVFKKNFAGHYCFFITQNGYAELSSYNGSKWTTIQSKRWDYKHARELYQTLKVVCDGVTIQCYIDGKKIIDIKDKTLTDSVNAGICCDDNVVCGFKNFSASMESPE